MAEHTEDIAPESTAADEEEYDPTDFTVPSTEQTAETTQPSEQPKVSGMPFLPSDDEDDTRDAPNGHAPPAEIMKINGDTQTLSPPQELDNVTESMNQDARAVSSTPTRLQANTESAPSRITPITQNSSIPQGPVAVLEARIEEDPRGDIDAWLELIREHQSKGKLEEARKVYERYFALFPSAVSSMVQSKESS